MPTVIDEIFELHRHEWVSPRTLDIMRKHNLSLTYPQGDGDGTYINTLVKDRIVKDDRKLLANLRERTLFIRVMRPNEFETYDNTISYPPRLWILVGKLNSIMTRVPIWRGNIPYELPPMNDFAVMEVVRKCFALNGLDNATLESWFKTSEHEREHLYVR